MLHMNATLQHHSDVIMTAMASQITSLTVVHSTVYSGADQRKHQSSASQAFVGGIHRWPVNSPRKGPVARKKFPFDDVIMSRGLSVAICSNDIERNFYNEAQPRQTVVMLWYLVWYPVYQPLWDISAACYMAHVWWTFNGPYGVKRTGGACRSGWLGHTGSSFNWTWYERWVSVSFHLGVIWNTLLCRPSFQSARCLLMARHHKVVGHP